MYLKHKGLKSLKIPELVKVIEVQKVLIVLDD